MDIHTKSSEIQVLEETMSELRRFEKRLEALIKECEENKGRKYYCYSRHRGAVKRAAIDLRKQLALITTASGAHGTYYHNK